MTVSLIVVLGCAIAFGLLALRLSTVRRARREIRIFIKRVRS